VACLLVTVGRETHELRPATNCSAQFLGFPHALCAFCHRRHATQRSRDRAQPVADTASAVLELVERPYRSTDFAEIWQRKCDIRRQLSVSDTRHNCRSQRLGRAGQWHLLRTLLTKAERLNAIIYPFRRMPSREGPFLDNGRYIGC